MRKHLTPAIIAILIGSVLFFAGRFTAKPAEDPHTEIIRNQDSLRRSNQDLQRKLFLTRDTVRQLTILSDTWYHLYDSLERHQRPAIKTKFKNDTDLINNSSLAELDSMFRKRYPD